MVYPSKRNDPGSLDWDAFLLRVTTDNTSKQEYLCIRSNYRSSSTTEFEGHGDTRLSSRYVVTFDGKITEYAVVATKVRQYSRIARNGKRSSEIISTVAADQHRETLSIHRGRRDHEIRDGDVATNNKSSYAFVFPSAILYPSTCNKRRNKR